MTVVLVDPRRPSLVPVEAVELLAGDVQYTEEMPIKVPWSLPAGRPWLSGAAEDDAAPVLLSSDVNHPAVRTRIAAGDRVISAPDAPAGERLVDAVAMMDKLRTAGPWESEQTHESLRRYLLEETYELFDAVRGGNAEEMREELGDVLLQVLFHARIAEDAAQQPFTIDDVADSLVRKLGNRVPGVLAGEQVSLEAQLAQWEERKAAEKALQGRVSAMDDVPTGQPALALAQKVLARATQAGVPADLIPTALTTVRVSADVDAENDLRSAVLAFMDTVRAAERAVSAGRRGDDAAAALDGTPPGQITADEWRAHWPGAEPVEVAAEAGIVEAEAVEGDDAEPGSPEPDEAQAEVPAPGVVEDDAEPVEPAEPVESAEDDAEPVESTEPAQAESVEQEAESPSAEAQPNSVEPQ